MNSAKRDIIEITHSEAEQLPLPLEPFEPLKTIRPEHNIGKFAGVIFISPYAKNVWETRSHQWQITFDDEELEASLTITPLQGHKTPTTTSLRVFLALLQVWEHMGRPEDGVVVFSSRQLAELIGWRWAGSDTANRIYEHIEILGGTQLSWLFSYSNPDGGLEEMKSGMNILSTTEYRAKKTIRRAQLFSSIQRVRLNPDLVQNMLAGHVRPLNYEAIRSIANDTTANLYARIDVYLAKKRHWERRAYPLIRDELGLSGRRYEKKFLRHQLLKQFQKELNGVELLNGKLTLSIAPTADGEDWKLVAEKVPRIQPKKRNLKPVADAESARYLADELIEAILREDRSGSPKRGFIEFLCRMYPSHMLRDALSIAKADYRGRVRTTLTRVFVYELEQLVRRNPNLIWYRDSKKNP